MICHFIQMIRVHNRHQNRHIVNNHYCGIEDMKSEPPSSESNPRPCAPHLAIASHSSGLICLAVPVPWCSGLVVECIHHPTTICPNNSAPHLGLQHCATSARYRALFYEAVSHEYPRNLALTGNLPGLPPARPKCAHQAMIEGSHSHRSCLSCKPAWLGTNKKQQWFKKGIWLNAFSKNFDRLAAKSLNDNKKGLSHDWHGSKQKTLECLEPRLHRSRRLRRSQSIRRFQKIIKNLLVQL